MKRHLNTRGVGSSVIWREVERKDYHYLKFEITTADFSRSLSVLVVINSFKGIIESFLRMFSATLNKELKRQAT